VRVLIDAPHPNLLPQGEKERFIERWRNQHVELEATTTARSRFLQPRHHPLRRKGHFAQPHAGRIEDGVADRRGNGNCRLLSSSQRCHLRPVDEHNIEFRDVGESQYRIAAPIKARHAIRVEGDFFEKRPADALDNVSFGLIFHTVGIDDQAAVMRADNAFHADLAVGLIDFHVRDRGDVGIGPLRQSDAPTLDKIAAQ
jgi:hypothetical protein